MEIGENLVVIVPNAPFLAKVVKQTVKHNLVGTRDLVGISISSDVFLLQSREMPVKLGIKIYDPGE